MANIVDLLRYGLVTISEKSAATLDKGRVQKDAVKASARRSTK